MANPMDFGTLLQQLAATINPSVRGGAGAGGLGGGLGTGGSGLPSPYDLMNPRLLGLTPQQLDEIFFQMSDNARDMYLRQLLKIPSVTEQQRVLNPDLDLDSPRFQIQRLFPVSPSPSRMPIVPGGVPFTWGQL